MARLTAKLKAAKECVLENKLAIQIYAAPDVIYTALQGAGYWWSSDKQAWEREAAAQPAMDGSMIRVWARTDEVERIARMVCAMMEQQGMRLVEMSQPYQCRPPRQAESRVYLRFVER